MMSAQIISTVFSYTTAILGLFGTFYYGIKSTRLQHLLTRFAWSDVQHGVDILCKKVTSDFRPDIVLTLSVPGRIISSLMMIRSLRVSHDVGVITITSNVTDKLLKNYFVIKTPKFSVGVPKALLSFRDHKILIIDSAVVTGDLLTRVRSLLMENGIAVENMRSAALIVTEFALQSGKACDYYWRVVRDAEYSLPWGNLSMRWY
jgi:hypoxanthine phosphoribosyltransferase